MVVEVVPVALSASRQAYSLAEVRAGKEDQQEGDAYIPLHGMSRGLVTDAEVGETVRADAERPYCGWHRPTA